MAVLIGSASLRDEEFLEAFHSCDLPLSAFRHGDHLRLAWIHLHAANFEDALAHVRIGIQRFAGHYGLPNLYHETITTAWVKLLATHREASFSDFLEANAHRLDLGLLHRFWTPATLNGAAARAGWIPPDRQALPAA